MRNQVSKFQVREILRKYLADDLANRMFWEIVDADENDRKNMIGMTMAEWMERFDDDFEVVWAADTNAGFGKRGDSVYGNIDDCVITSTRWNGHKYTLLVWCESLTTDDVLVNAVMNGRAKRA